MHISVVFIHCPECNPLATDPHAQLHRRDAIVRILRQSAVGRQAELVELLHAEGFEATQSSVSRDLRELGVMKGADRYLLPAVEDALTPSHFEAVQSFVKGYRAAGPNLTVLRTTAGTAQSVAIALDKARWPEVVGTIAGDDTIFIATESARTQRQLHDRLRSTFGR
jgi:transcriptional regulator of arginine metabolism